jgi:hypothetical protein
MTIPRGVDSMANQLTKLIDLGQYILDVIIESIDFVVKFISLFFALSILAIIWFFLWVAVLLRIPGACSLTEAITRTRESVSDY